MPADVSVEFKQDLALEACIWATCIRVVRRDGTTFGFTTLDEELSYDLEIDSTGLVQYSPMGGINPTAIKMTETSGVDTMDVDGLITTDRISELDIKAGRYKKADVVVFRVNPLALNHGHRILTHGFIGEISKREGIYTFEVRSLHALLKMAIGNLTSPLCRVKRFCDAQCKLDEADYTFESYITAVISRTNIKFYDDHPTDFYTYGIARSTSGENNGVEREIKLHDRTGANVADCELKEVFPFPIELADTFELIQGCNRAIDACSSFPNPDNDSGTNIENMRAEPHLPQNEKITKVARPPK